MSEQLKRTPLFDVYSSYGGKTIDFGGWELPVQFSSIKEEHEAVRTKAGLFDVSHMGEVFVKGPNSESYLQSLVTNDISKLVNGQAQYNVMCYKDGGIVDDLLVYKLEDQHYLLVVNAGNIEKDFEWMKQNTIDGVELDNRSNDYGLLALQGPKAQEILQKLTSQDLTEIKFFRFKDNIDVSGKQVLVSRTGYTGEDGFEIYAASNDMKDLWSSILEAGKEEGLLPCGLGARDTLRFEACLPLYGQELSKDITPLEAGLGFVVKLNKEQDFNGKSVLVEQKENGVPRKSIGIEMIDKGIPRTGYPIFANDKQIGFVTTGTQSPTLKKNIGLVLIDATFAEIGQEVEVEIRNKRLKAVTIPTPFYKREK
ncbi:MULTISPECIES: glycine cleavage system aminomethyltransferase GcvT [Psychrobacillus]|uniref:Aminomethyltransferase n=1 Tax=Psychrobacillus faecigallinarum TaxID=2762235 RepID=A0ABR8R8B2_9BACI|nr:glycine cleavage system aminomethyltransferase GcvT [Psychrobacillus faecigallinarum]MBD7943895.1 glycine cleavage system aminomethyltransferase GcvT [Psychrobacillus faecigallinarum]QGM29895.1 glycine cleavage system aminomethyltransferase GcvT [Bacillus sp. N3536]